MRVFDGDDIYGERCELGRNDRHGRTFELYREGERRVTYISYRLPGGFPLDSPRWQTVMQMKQTQPYANLSGGPAIEMQVRGGRWILRSDWRDIWSTPAQRGLWTRFALDVFYSRNPSRGSIEVHVDLNGDGDADDPGEESPRIRTETLKVETAGGEEDRIAPGESIPSHLRVGLYHDPAISCPPPAGCRVDVDNVQVMGPDPIGALLLGWRH